ncbi:MAG: SRPBCC domain-containing protein [Saprospiraceae bacterium]|nr:SRPBCC domain-containing protein [Bacteroidia bacterium]NNE13832.1 SRPBCC domain-containing protein [Saprospiraceae bacterium]NNL93391.1 SRPBCC domain-containing protein [Saprospiraceae bacterium]
MIIIKLATFLLAIFCYCTTISAQETKRVTSIIDSSYIGELVLIQEFDVNVPLDDVWDAYTTKEGWEGAFVPKADVDFKVGGLIRTSYDPNATIGDSTTIYLHIINYVPKKLLTLQAEISRNFPEFMKSDAKDFYNVITFDALEEEKTKVVSYGIGYKNTEKYMSLMKFFIQGNEMSYEQLIDYLEKNK